MGSCPLWRSEEKVSDNKLQLCRFEKLNRKLESLFLAYSKKQQQLLINKNTNDMKTLTQKPNKNENGERRQSKYQTV